MKANKPLYLELSATMIPFKDTHDIDSFFWNVPHQARRFFRVPHTLTAFFASQYIFPPFLLIA